LSIYIIIHNNYGNTKHNNIVTSHINNNASSYIQIQQM